MDRTRVLIRVDGVPYVDVWFVNGLDGLEEDAPLIEDWTRELLAKAGAPKGTISIVRSDYED